MIGEHPTWLAAMALADRAAQEPVSILITGETGTGKEGTAKRIHEASGRLGYMCTVNCAGLTPNLIDAELYGYEKGAFTGASQARQGLFHAAHGGTLFLDEVGELPLDVQARLLRALQDGSVRRIGSMKEEKVDVRVIAATHKNLWAAVSSGTFRRDLVERLADVEIMLPPLRARGADILRIARELIASDEVIKGGLVLGEEERKTLLKHTWPGNVRELRRVLRRAVLLGVGVAEVLNRQEQENLADRLQELAKEGPLTAETVEVRLGVQRRHAQRLLATSGLKGHKEGRVKVYERSL